MCEVDQNGVFTEWIFYPTKILFDKRVSGIGKMLYIYLCDMCDEKGRCYESTKTICKKARISKNTYYKYKKILEEYGYIKTWEELYDNDFSRITVIEVVGYEEILKKEIWRNRK